MVRHPQYASGIGFLFGWFLLWGGLYSLAVLPILVLVICLQARIEEKLVLEEQFGEEYEQYKKRVGMFVPRLRRGPAGDRR